MKRVLLVGGPADGMVKTIDDGLMALSCGKDRYTEVVFGEQKPLRVFKLDTMQDDLVLHKLADFYARVHEERLDPHGLYS
jgi:hypothetical protein